MARLDIKPKNVQSTYLDPTTTDSVLAGLWSSDRGAVAVHGSSVPRDLGKSKFNGRATGWIQETSPDFHDTFF